MEPHASEHDPEFYAEILSLSFAGGPRRAKKDTQDATHDSHLSSLLNTAARLVISSPHQVAAVAISTGAGTDTPEERAKSTIYITYNHDLDSNQKSTTIAHVLNLFNKMKQIVPPDVDGSPRNTNFALDSSGDAIMMSMLNDIYSFSRSILKSYLCAKQWQHALEKATAAIVYPQNPPAADEFSEDEREVLRDVFFRLRKATIMAQEDDEDIRHYISFLHSKYLRWVKAGYMRSSRPGELLEEDDLDEEDMDISDSSSSDAASGSNSVSESRRPESGQIPRKNIESKAFLFKRVEDFMATQTQDNTRFPLEGWIHKILSLHVACSNLVQLRISRRLRTLMEGTIEVEILPSALPGPPYDQLRLGVGLQDDAVRDVISGVRQQFGTMPVVKPFSVLGDEQYTDLVEEFQRFILKRLQVDDTKKPCRNPSNSDAASHPSPSVHCELSMAYHIHLRNLPVLSYIGVSRLSCALCTLYLEVFSSVVHRRLVTLGSPNKFRVYPEAWIFPCFDKETDDTIRTQLVQKIREKLAIRMIDFIKEKLERSRSAASDDDWSRRDAKAALYELDVDVPER